MFKKFLSLLSHKEKRKSIWIMFLLLCLTGSEFISIGLIMPFISLIMDPGIIEESTKVKYIYELLEPDSILVFEIYVALSLIALFVLKALFAGYADRKRIQFGKEIEFNMMSRYLRSTLLNPYPFFFDHPASALYHRLVGETPQVAILLQNLLIFFSEATVAMAIIGLFFLVNPKITLFMFFGFVVVLSLIYLIHSQYVKDVAEKRIFFGLKRGRSSLQNLNGIKDLKIFNNEHFFLKKFKEYNFEFLKSEGNLAFLTQIQYRFIEMIAYVVVLSVILIMLLGDQQIEKVIPLLGVYVAGIFRLLPSTMRMLNSATLMRHSGQSVDVIHDDFWQDHVKQEILMAELKENDLYVDKKKRFPFKEKITVEIEEFFYESRESKVFHDFSIEFLKNQTVGLVGGSGSGKTTLIDIILGLNLLEKGRVCVDGVPVQGERSVQLRNNIGYVPQRVFLYDTSILNNVAFGYEGDEIDRERVDKVIEIAQLKKFIQELPDGLDTIVGEFGVKISGGQLQRIGIARALYHNPEILILDEATSSLDNKTEEEFMATINKLKGQKTIIISAHRLSTIKPCNIIYFLKNGKVQDSGTYQHLIDNSTDFQNLVTVGNNA